MSAEGPREPDAVTDGPIGAVRAKTHPQQDYCSLDNEAARVFLPIIGVSAFALYVTLATDALGNSQFQSNQRQLASKAGQSLATVSRNIRILIHLGMIRIISSGGSNDTTYQLMDLKELCRKHGATERFRASLVLPENTCERLKRQVAALRCEIAGKRQAERCDSSEQRSGNRGGNLESDFHQRDASVSPETRQRFAGETQTGFYQLRKKEEEKNSPSPTPSRSGKAETPKNLPIKGESDELRKQAVNRFTGVIKDMQDHLLGSNRPQAPHFTNGFDDWQKYGFDSLAVESAARRGEVLELVLSASDPAAARRGLKKYRQKWEASLHTWFGIAVQVDIQQTPPIW